MTNRFLSGAICLLLAPLSALAGCTATPPPANRPSVPAQPRMAAYRCGDDGDIRIENLGSMVRVYEPIEEGTLPEEGDADAPGWAPIELAAAPPGQQSRYGSNGYALVLEGNEALWMKAGKTPLTCVR